MGEPEGPRPKYHRDTDLHWPLMAQSNLAGRTMNHANKGKLNYVHSAWLRVGVLAEEQSGYVLAARAASG